MPVQVNGFEGNTKLISTSIQVHFNRNSENPPSRGLVMLCICFDLVLRVHENIMMCVCVSTSEKAITSSVLTSIMWVRLNISGANQIHQIFALNYTDDFNYLIAIP